MIRIGGYSFTQKYLKQKQNNTLAYTPSNWMKLSILIVKSAKGTQKFVVVKYATWNTENSRPGPYSIRWMWVTSIWWNTIKVEHLFSFSFHPNRNGGDVPSLYTSPESTSKRESIQWNIYLQGFYRGKGIFLQNRWNIL